MSPHAYLNDANGSGHAGVLTGRFRRVGRLEEDETGKRAVAQAVVRAKQGDREGYTKDLDAQTSLLLGTNAIGETLAVRAGDRRADGSRGSLGRGLRPRQCAWHAHS